MELLIIYLIFGGACAAIANSKGRNAVAWFFIGMIFSCFAIILLLCLPNLKEQKEKERRLEEENRRIREQVRQEQMKLETFRQVTDVRLNYHDRALGMSTAPTAASPLGIGGKQGGEVVPPALPTPDDPSKPNWHYVKDGVRSGPITTQAARALIGCGELTSTTVFWKAGMSGWVPASQIAELS